MSSTLHDQPPRLFDARLHGGPHEGTRTRVAALPSGQPTEFLSSHDDDRGLYLLAGAPDSAGVLPFWWMTWKEAAILVSLRPGLAQVAVRIKQVT